MTKLSAFAFVLVTLLACSNRVNTPTIAIQARPGNFCTSPQKITAIYKDYVYDLNGYEGIAGNSAFNLFDENAFVDPKKGGDFHPATNPNPILANSFYWPKGRGNRIVVDLRVPYKISEVYIYDMARQADSIWIYTGTMNNWKLKAAITTKGDMTQWGWRRLPIEDSTQYIMIRLNSWEASVTEAVFYGCPYSDPPKAPAAEYAGERLPAKTLKEFLGINTYQTVPLKWMKPFYNTRLYTPVDFIDRDTINEFPNQQFNLAAQGWFNGAERDYTFFADSIARYANARIWYSLKGVPYWMKKKGLDDWDRPVSKIGMNTEDPMSYGRHSSMLWHLAALYGTNKVDTNLLQVYNSPRFSGRGLMNVFENGNEVDANWVGDKYCNPIEYFAISTADYDGHEGKLGSQMGLKSGDPKSELMMAGLCGLDTNRVRILSFLCNTLRRDKKFVWQGGVQYHSYSVDGKGRFPGEAFAYSTRGTSPEEDSLRIRMKKVRDYTYKYAPGVECILGEYGYDKYQKSKMSTPLVKGYNEKQSQGIMLLRGINAVAFSGFDRLTIYWIKDDWDETKKEYQAFFLSCGVILHKSQNEYEPYPSWFYISTLINQMGDYKPESIVSEKGNVWVYKYRHKSAADSVAYFVYVPTYNGTKIDNYQLNVGRRATSATEITLKDNSEIGNSATRAVRGGVVSVNATEAPKLILVKEN
ncbi:MAG: hypothetical protein H7Y31_17770 [Chitinophagaceae bacterium]|nr:hypothetical protein [Chitinophagaceae bacterium]